MAVFDPSGTCTVTNTECLNRFERQWPRLLYGPGSVAIDADCQDKVLGIES